MKKKPSRIICVILVAMLVITGTVTSGLIASSTAAGGTAADGSTTPALTGNFATNPNNQYGARKTITVDGDKSDWEASMLIAQGTANDDPRVYRDNAMYELGTDDYALYAAWDNDNLYLMWEMANVQDMVAPNDDFPLVQGNLWLYNFPIFIAINTGLGNVTDGTTADGGTLLDSGISYTTDIDTLIVCSTNGSYGPAIYPADENGKVGVAKYSGADTGINMKWGNAKTLSGGLIGVNGAYGQYNNRTPGDTLNDSSDWVNFYDFGHDKKLDMFYEMSIPLEKLGITASDIETNGIGIMKISTYGESGMDSLPYDPSMSDNADKPYSQLEPLSNEIEDEDNITVPLARIGKALSVADYVLGDVNFDGQVNTKDAELIQKYLAGKVDLDDIQKSVADTNGDGQINIFDATRIKRYDADLIDEL